MEIDVEVVNYKGKSPKSIAYLIKKGAIPKERMRNQGSPSKSMKKSLSGRRNSCTTKLKKRVILQAWRSMNEAQILISKQWYMSNWGTNFQKQKKVSTPKSFKTVQPVTRQMKNGLATIQEWWQTSCNNSICEYNKVPSSQPFHFKVQSPNCDYQTWLCKYHSFKVKHSSEQWTYL